MKQCDGNDTTTATDKAKFTKKHANKDLTIITKEPEAAMDPMETPTSTSDPLWANRIFQPLKIKISPAASHSNKSPVSRNAMFVHGVDAVPLKSPSSLSMSRSPIAPLALKPEKPTSTSETKTTKASASPVKQEEELPPVSPTLLKEMSLYLDPMARYLPDPWTHDSPRHVYAMLSHPPPTMDAHAFPSSSASTSTGSTTTTSTTTTPAPAPGLISPLMQLQLQQQQQQLQHLQHHLQLHQPPSLGMPMVTSPLSMIPTYYTLPSQLLASPHAPPLHHSAFPLSYPPTPTTMSAELMDAIMQGTSTSTTTTTEASTDSTAAASGTSASPSPTSAMKSLLPPVLPRTSPVNVKELTLNELRPHFNKPMAVVAKELGVCITLMKKICRRNGLVRWPHRRIRSLVNRITSLQVIAGNSSGAERKRFESQIATLRDELSAVIENPNEKSRKAQADAKARGPGHHATLLTTKQPPTEQEEAVLAAASTIKVDSAKRKTTVLPPPPIKIPRIDESTVARASSLRKTTTPHKQRRLTPGSRSSDDDDHERPSSTTSTGSKRGSISSILCDDDD